VKTSSETESVATRPLDPGEEIDPTEEHPFKLLSDQELAGTPLALPRTRSPARRRLERAPRPPGLLLALPRGEASAPDPLWGRGRRPFVSVIAASPRAPRHIPHQPSSNPRWSPSPGEDLGWAYRELLMTSDAEPVLRMALRRRCPRHATPSDPRFGAAGCSTRASSTSRCRMGDRPSAEAREPSITVCPSSPLRACARQNLPVLVRERVCAVRSTSPFGPVFRRAHRVSSKGTTPRRVSLPSTRSAIHRTARSGADQPARKLTLSGHSRAPDSFTDFPSLGKRCESRRYSSPECLPGPAAPLLR